MRLRVTIANLQYQAGQRLQALGTFLKSHFIDLHFYGGLLCFGYGASCVYPGSGFLVLGGVLLLYIRPLKGWFSK